MTAETKLVAAKDIVEGMLVDLESDPYADPRGDDFSYECEYQEVIDVCRETTDCVRIDFIGSSVGFPPCHMLKVKL